MSVLIWIVWIFMIKQDIFPKPPQNICFLELAENLKTSLSQPL